MSRQDWDVPFKEDKGPGRTKSHSNCIVIPADPELSSMLAVKDAL